VVLADARLIEPLRRLGRPLVRQVVRTSQERSRSGALLPAHLIDDILDNLPAHATSLKPVLNATGTILHTNLGRAPLSDAARDAQQVASGYVDIEFDLANGTRAPRGRGGLAALRAALPGAGDVMVVNNGAAALLLAMLCSHQAARSYGVVASWSRSVMASACQTSSLAPEQFCAKWEQQTKLSDETIQRQSVIKPGACSKCTRPTS